MYDGTELILNWIMLYDERVVPTVFVQEMTDCFDRESCWQHLNTCHHPLNFKFQKFWLFNFSIFCNNKIRNGNEKLHKSKDWPPSMTCPPAPSIRVLMVQLSIINPHTKKATFARLKFLWENTVFLSIFFANTNDKAFAQRGKRYEL